MPTPLSDKPLLAEYQRHIAELVDEHGFTKDLERVFILLTEEVGELAHDIRLTWKDGPSAQRAKLSSELADVFIYVLDLANLLGIDLEQATRDKLAYNETRGEYGA